MTAHGPAPAAATPSTAAPQPPGGGAGSRVSVRHADGVPVPRAALTLVDTAGRQVARAETAADGSGALAAPAAGTYVLIAAAGGHQPQAVTVTLAGGPVDVDVVLGGTGRLSGTVRTEGGSPLPAAVVTLTDDRGEVVATARSGADGGYVLPGLVAGAYTLSAGAPAFSPAALPVSVRGARETLQDLELAGAAVLGGVVRSGGGGPVDDARVTLLDAEGDVIASVTTAADGVYRFTGLAAGCYTVIASGYPPRACELRLPGGTHADHDVRLTHGADR